MGIPGFFSWLNNSFKQILNKNLIQQKIYFQNNMNNQINYNTDYLFFDANSIIHHISSKIIIENSNISNDDLENQIFINVINYIDKIITLIRPNKLIYISIDGVVPMGKIKQQRIRRYKTEFDKKIKINLKKQLNLDTNYNFKWSSSCISPGTEFMNKLNEHFINYINVKKNNLGSQKIQIIYSSSFDIGEGEHKIMNYIKNNTLSNSNISIYGLDADLIFLCLQLQQNIYILRDDNRLDENSNTISVISVNDVKEFIIYIFNNIQIIENKFEKDSYYSQFFKNYKVFSSENDQMKDYVISEFKLNNERLLNDFVFICFLLGNDFIPHLMSIQLKIIKNKNLFYNVIELLILSYYKISQKYQNYIVFEQPICKINMEMFYELLQILSQIEYQTIYNIHNYEFVQYQNLNQNQIFDINKLDNTTFNFNDINILTSLQVEKYIYKPQFLNKIVPNINFIENYNEYYFKNNSLDSIIDNYIESIFWTFFYYNKDCNDWIWYYKYNNAPLLYNIINYIDMNKLQLIFNKMSININNKGIIQPYEHICLVLPKKLHYLIPIQYQKIIKQYLNQNYPNFLNKIIKNPNKYGIDFFNKTKLWQCNPIIEDFDPINILNILKLYINNNIKSNTNINLYDEYNLNYINI